MDNKIAQTHTHTSNRAKKQDGKDKQQDKKVVFKGVLDTPFRITWPSVSINAQVSILEGILHSLKEITVVNAASSRKRRRMTCPEDDEEHEDAQPCRKDIQASPKTHFIHGINAVTRRLESDIHRSNTLRISTETITKETSELVPLKYVFVCRADINPSLIVDHLPHLVAAYNSRKPTPVILCPLPEGAEKVLAEVLGVRRAAVLAIDVTQAQYGLPEKVDHLLQTVPPLRASWLAAGEPQSLIPTHTKHLRTTAPKDMKAAKIQRTEERSRTKKLKQEKS